MEDFKSSKNRLYPEKEVDNFRNFINNCATEYKDKIAFSYKKNPDSKTPEFIDVSYIQYQKDIEGLGTSLLALGLEGKRVALISPNRYYWCVSYMAITISNMIGVPLDRALPANEIESLIIRSQADAVIFDKKYQDTFQHLKENGNSNLKYYICMDLEQNSSDYLSYVQLVQEGKEAIVKGSTRFFDVTADKDKMSLMLFTSGTTAMSKAVMLSQHNICANVTAMTSLIRMYPEDSVLSFLPLHHTLECTATFLFCFYTGARICFCDGIKNIPKNMKEYGISGLVCVPALLEVMYRQIKKTIKAKGLEIPFKILMVVSNSLRKIGIDIRRKAFKSVIDNLGGKLRIIIYGSASTDKEIVKFFDNLGILMMQGYGLTETSPVIACESDKYRRASSTGFPLFNQEVKIENPDENGVGEIITKGPNVMLGYYENEEATKEILKDGWLFTGDLGYFDKDGFLYVTGRKKDVIVLKNGKNVFPQEIEMVFNKSDLVTESFVYAKTDTDGDIKLGTKIVYNKESPEFENKSIEEIQTIINAYVKEVNTQLPGYKYVREVLVTDEPLIKTTTEKIKRHEEMKKIM